MTHHTTRDRVRVRVRVRVRTTSLRTIAVALVVMHAAAVLAVHAMGRVPRPRDDRGQSTVEYALILLGAAAIALVVVAWVTRTDAIGRLFDTVIGRVLQQAD